MKICLNLILTILMINSVFAYSNNEIGVGFSDLIVIFKTGFVDGIFGSWFLAGLGLIGIFIYLGVNLGWGMELLLFFTILIGFNLVLMSILPTIVSVIIGFVAAIVVYFIYIKIFKR